jgi:hypothetical protein
MSDKGFKVKNGLTIQGTVDTLITADNAGGILVAGAPISSLPSQTGNTGKILSTDGSNPSWITAPSSGNTIVDGGTANSSFTDNIDGGNGL